MKIELIYDDKQSHKPVIGWKMIPESEQDDKNIAYIRDLSFFGFLDTAIEYNSLVLKDEEKGKNIGNIKELSWIQAKYNK